MRTFDPNRTIHGVGDLTDGVMIAACLKNMFVSFDCLPWEMNWDFYSSDGNHFNDNWLQKIRLDASDNYRIKVCVQLRSSMIIGYSLYLGE